MNVFIQHCASNLVRKLVSSNPTSTFDELTHILDLSQKPRESVSVDVTRDIHRKRPWQRAGTGYLDSPRRRSDISDDRIPNEPSANSGPSHEIQPNSADMASNFVKAIGLSSLIHPTHDLCEIFLPPGQGTISSSGSLLNLVGAQELLLDACHVLNVSLPQFQYL